MPKAAEITVNPTVPELELAFTIRTSIGEALAGGRGPKGERLHIPITGGTVEGPLLQGKVLPGGSDWPVIRPDGASRISARYTIKAADGSPIYVRNEGLRVSAPDITQRLRAGDPVDPGEYYFRSSPGFEAPNGPHGWLNDALFVASLARDGDQIVIAVYQIT